MSALCHWHLLDVCNHPTEDPIDQLLDQESNFPVYLSSIQSFHHQIPRSSITIVTVVLLSRARCRCRWICWNFTSHLLNEAFFLPESFLNTVKCLHLRTGALMPIEG